MFYAHYRIGMCYLKLSSNNTKLAKSEFLKAYAIDPHRKEPLYYLARIARIEKDYALCLLYAGAAMQIGVPWSDALFVEGNIYNWQLEEEYAMCQYYTGRKKTAQYHWKRLVDNIKMPEETKKRIIKNLKY